MAQELLEFFFLIKSRCQKFLPPERNIHVLGRTPYITNVLIFYYMLVIGGHVESPYVFFVQSMVYSWNIGIRRISVQTLTLNIIKVKLLIIILNWNSKGITNSCSLLRVKRLEPLEVIILNERNIIHIVEKVGIFL